MSNPRNGLVGLIALWDIRMRAIPQDRRRYDLVKNRIFGCRVGRINPLQFGKHIETVSNASKNGVVVVEFAVGQKRNAELGQGPPLGGNHADATAKMNAMVWILGFRSNRKRRLAPAADRRPAWAPRPEMTS